MGSSFLNKDSNIQKNQVIMTFGGSVETYDTSKYQNNYNKTYSDDKSDFISSKRQNSILNENNTNYSKPKINTTSEISPVLSPNISHEEINYELSIIKESDKEKDILNKLYDMFEQEDSNTKSVIIKYYNGEKYIGEWDAKNHKQGRGIQIFINNNIYYGYWENNNMNGIGKMIKFKEKINDLNIIFNENIVPYYFGNWKNNLQDGEGEEIWKDNSIYKGEYKEGLKHGKGILKLPNGSEYEGEFSNGKIEGKGKMKYVDGRTYEGSWLNNKMNGKGIFNWPDGRKYKGNYLNNYKNGFGEFIWPDGRIYKGMWANGIQNGEGKFYNKEYDIWIECLWKDGKRIKNNNY